MKNSNYIIIFLLFFLSGCDRELNRMYQDVEIKKTREDYENLFKNDPCKVTPIYKRKTHNNTCNNIDQKYKTKVSISISGNIPITEAIINLASQLNINIVIDKSISKTTKIFYKASNQAFIDVLKTICAMSGLRYYFANNILNICEDVPYIKTYNIRLPLISRNVKSKTSVKTDVLSSDHKNLSASDNGSNISLDTKDASDLYQELEKNLTLILGDDKKNGSYSIDKYSGIVSIFGTDKQQKMIESYLLQMQRLLSSQVLIEAKIIEVALSNNYQSGINWSSFFSNKNKNDMAIFGPFSNGTNGVALDKITPQRDVFSFACGINNFSAIANFLEKFGTTRTIANPRVTVLNNQAAIFKVARNEVFFQIHIEDVLMQSPNPALQKTESKIQTVPIGLIMFVQPSINFDTGEITLYLQATISRIVDYKEDPAVSISSRGQSKSKIPVTQMRELNTVIRGKEGETIVTGGLMEEINHNETSGLPEISNIPIIGGFFSEKESNRQVSELVILMRLSIVEANETITSSDEIINNEFVKDEIKEK